MLVPAANSIQLLTKHNPGIHMRTRPPKSAMTLSPPPSFPVAPPHPNSVLTEWRGVGGRYSFYASQHHGWQDTRGASSLFLAPPPTHTLTHPTHSHTRVPAPVLVAPASLIEASRAACVACFRMALCWQQILVPRQAAPLLIRTVRRSTILPPTSTAVEQEQQQTQRMLQVGVCTHACTRRGGSNGR
jgi:hypothetical protein